MVSSPDTKIVFRALFYERNLDFSSCPSVYPLNVFLYPLGFKIVLGVNLEYYMVIFNGTMLIEAVIAGSGS